MTLEQRLAAIQARLEAATPGPWYQHVHGEYAMRVAETDTMKVFAHEPVDIQRQDNDAELIAHAPSDLAFLTAALKVACEAHKEIGNRALGDVNFSEAQAFGISRDCLAEIARLAAGGG